MDRPILKKILLVFILCCLYVIRFDLAIGQEDPSFQKGISYVTWEKERYSSVYSDQSLEKLAQTGAGWLAVITTYYQKDFNSKEIFPTERTPSDKSLIHLINYAHRLGLKVMLKPHLDLLHDAGGLGRADIGFQKESDWQVWFTQYLKFILHYADLAQESRVEIFCVGTELSFASSQTAFWQELVIPAVRKAYSGKLIYAANWDEYRNIRFWQSLDYVGIDAYFPLGQKVNPHTIEIKKSWQEWARKIGSWQKLVNKPIIFTEIGYRSCNFAAARPWDSGESGTVDLGIQADCYRAALEVASGLDWCKGIYWWYWKASPFAGGINNRDFTPQNKPAEIVLTNYYRGLALAQLK